MLISDITYIKTKYGNTIFIQGQLTETGAPLFQRAIPATLELDTVYLDALKIVMFAEWEAEQAEATPEVI